MLTWRTDLALEAAQLWRESAGAAGALPGVESAETRREGYPVTTVRVLDKTGEEALGKPAGTYVTLELDGLARREEDAFGRAARALAAELTPLLPPDPSAPVLVAGLGNRAVTPDNIGPKAADHTLVTRHLVEQAPEHFGAFRPVAALAAGVLGSTGVESGQLIQAVAEKIRPACVLCVDALAARGVRRVCRTVQLADTGITPAPAWATPEGPSTPGRWGCRSSPSACPPWWTRPPSPGTCWPRPAGASWSRRPWAAPGRGSSSPPRTSTPRSTTWPSSSATASTWPSTPGCPSGTSTCC